MTRLASMVPDGIQNLLAPEIVVPCQLAGSPRFGRGAGERALMLAVLEDAMRCLQGSGRVNLLARDAERWVRANEPAQPFSFVSICDALGIDVAALRRVALAPVESRPAPRLRLRVRPRPRGISLRWRRRRAANQ